MPRKGDVGLLSARRAPMTQTRGSDVIFSKSTSPQPLSFRCNLKHPVGVKETVVGRGEIQ